MNSKSFALTIIGNWKSKVGLLGISTSDSIRMCIGGKGVRIVAGQQVWLQNTVHVAQNTGPAPHTASFNTSMEVIVQIDKQDRHGEAQACKESLGSCQARRKHQDGVRGGVGCDGSIGCGQGWEQMSKGPNVGTCLTVEKDLVIVFLNQKAGQKLWNKFVALHPLWNDFPQVNEREHDGKDPSKKLRSGKDIAVAWMSHSTAGKKDEKWLPLITQKPKDHGKTGIVGGTSGSFSWRHGC